MNHKANLFIVGAMKAGTTSFCDSISQHPRIYFSPIKEPNYFLKNLPKRIYDPSRYFSLENYFQNKFPESLHIAHIKKREDYDLLFSKSNPNQFYKAEGSTAYLHAPESAELIYNYNPDSKIIIIVRDPLGRAFSHYKMDLGLGRTKKSFQTELINELKKIKNDEENEWGYISMSLYKQSITRFQKYFGENLLVLDFNDLVNNNEQVFDNVFEFLNIDKYELKIPHNNKTANLRFQKVFYFLKQKGFKDIFSHLVPTKIKHKMFEFMSHKKQLKLEVNDEVLEELNTLFLKDGFLLKK